MQNSFSQELQAKSLMNICKNDFRKYDGFFFDVNDIKKLSKKANDMSLQDKLWDKTIEFLKIKH